MIYTICMQRGRPPDAMPPPPASLSPSRGATNCARAPASTPVPTRGAVEPSALPQAGFNADGAILAPNPRRSFRSKVLALPHRTFGVSTAINAVASPCPRNHRGGQIHYLAFLPGDVFFIAHHLATLFVFLTCRYLVRHGAYALLVLLVLAEVTSLLQNVWMLAGIWRDQSPAAARVYGTLSPPFYALYTLVRGVAGPLFLLKMAAFYLSGQAVDVIPWWVQISWILVVDTAIAVSNLWIWNLWTEVVREWKQQAPPKSKKDT
jgi:hypothetical protein